MDDDQQMALKETKTKALTLLFPKEICFSLSFSHTPPSVLEDWANSGADFQELGGKGGVATGGEKLKITSRSCTSRGQL